MSEHSHENKETPFTCKDCKSTIWQVKYGWGYHCSCPSTFSGYEFHIKANIKECEFDAYLEKERNNTNV